MVFAASGSLAVVHSVNDNKGAVYSAGLYRPAEIFILSGPAQFVRSFCFVHIYRKDFFGKTFIFKAKSDIIKWYGKP